MKKIFFVPIILLIILAPQAKAQLVVQPISTHVVKSPLEIAFDILKKRIFDMVVDQIIDYINGNGQPQFITDWQGFLEQTAQVAIGDFVQEIGLGALCSPFRFQIQLAMVAPPRFSKQVTCTLGTIVRNVNNFYSDFRNGGWLTYQEMWAPNNNFYGSLILAWNAKHNAIASRVAAAQNEALASQGFLSMKKCAKDVYGRDIPSTCVIVTPGTSVGALASKAIGSDLDFIINSEDLGAYIAAISDALINRLIRSGVEGLGGITTPSRPPTQNYATGLGCDAFVGRARQDCLNYQYNYGSSYTKASQLTFAQIDASLQPRLAAQQILDNLIAAESVSINQLNYFVCPALVNQQQTNLFRHRQMRDDNNYIINQLVRASEEIGRSNQNSFSTVFLTQQITDSSAAQKTLTDAQAEQALYQPIQPGQCVSQ